MSNKPVNSIVKAASILETLGASSDGMSLGELSSSIQMKPPTVHNLLQTLLACDFIEKLQNPVRYQLGRGITRLANLRYSQSSHTRARSVLPVLAAESGGTAVLAELIDGHVIAVLGCRASASNRVNPQYGRVMAPYTTATALAYQAFCEQEELDAFRRRNPFSEYGLSAWESLEGLEEFLRKSRNAGLVEVHFEGDRLHKIAAPVRDESGKMRALLGTSIPVELMAQALRGTLLKRLVDLASAL